MRFSNWDVLLFPEDSRIPIQEFEVKCQALVQSHDTPIPTRLLSLANNNHEHSITHVPTLTCFVSSLEEGRPFRISIHSWEKPKPSDLLQSFKPVSERITFEAKLYIDGRLKAQRHMGQQNTWPEVIDNVMSNDLIKPMRFPPFHTEILQQSHWDAGDSLGRIRLVIAEGVSHPSGFGDVRGFDKLREIVAFSFQHAPRHILEYSGIAWPNARMFMSSPSARCNNNFDAHAHSPRRPTSTIAHHEKCSTKSMVSTPSSHDLHSSKWATTSVRIGNAIDDPFVGPTRDMQAQWQKKRGGDMTMQTASRANKSISEMSGVEMERPESGTNVDRDSIGALTESSAPSKQASFFHRLSPIAQSMSENCGTNTAKVVSQNIQLLRASESNSQSRAGNDQVLRLQSNQRRRSTSGRSGKMSWEDTPTYLWSGLSNDSPGLLSSLQSSSSKHRSTSIGSKRKRSLSPATLLPTDSDLRSNMKGMSTSPPKATSTPVNNIDDTNPSSH